MLRIALIGFGAIGSAAAELLQNTNGLEISAVVMPGESAQCPPDVLQRLHALAPRAQIYERVPEAGIDLVVEAAGHQALIEHVLPALLRGQSCMVASIGALSHPGLAEQLQQAAEQGGSKLELIAGAIGAIDALAAARIGGLDQVLYTGRKPPLAWLGTPAEQSCDLNALAQELVIFSGTAREAATQFPKNANVAATVALAGLGLDSTLVRLVADPAVQENIHTVQAQGAFGQFELSMRNTPLTANPKTSAQTVYSLVRAIRNRVLPVAI
ncbi:aspartate dehydrogenase [Lampropedia puyangensis]|uniref:L-aspartate dehydrogenase n=1 Tax=Lampropedia puyangensis TaxID=1330072 RepID=A0A4S8EN68_9BURK|nr:aspartate dehydrogenase [Lampropedia puyangensis]THT96157.1 aspartate dehydrogenase [Lampropedia puyangensis]